MPFVRVKDKETGHEFDVPETDWRISEGIFTVVKGDRFPPVDRPRPPKHNIQPIRAPKKEES
jgi:hypothetical protein